MSSRRRPHGGTLVPTELAALALGITQDGVRQLARRGRLTRHGSARRALYDVAELLAIREGRAGRLDDTDHPATV